MKRFGLYPEMHPEGDFLLCGSETGNVAEWLYLGRLSEYGKQYGIRLDVTKEKVIAIVGKRGQGKSYTLGSLLEGLCTHSEDNPIAHSLKKRGLLVFDTLNIFQWSNIPVTDARGQSQEMENQAALLDEWGIHAEPLDVDVWVPAGYRYETYPTSYRDLVLNVSDFTLADWSALLDLDVIRDIKGQYLAEIYDKVTTQGWTDENNGNHPPNSNYTLDDLASCIERDIDNAVSVYRPDTRRSVLQQFRAYSSHPIFSGMGTRLSEIVQAGRASIVLLNRLPDDLRGVVVSVMIRRLLQERAAASEAAKDLMINPNLDEAARRLRENVVNGSVPNTWVVIDEAQNLIPAGRRTSATTSLVKLVKEGRNFGLSFVVTTQQPRALDPNVLSQVETFLVHKLVSDADVNYILDNLKATLPTEIRDDNTVISMKELIRDISVGQVLVSDTNTQRCFLMEVRPRVSAHGGFEA